MASLTLCSGALRAADALRLQRCGLRHAQAPKAAAPPPRCRRRSLGVSVQARRPGREDYDRDYVAFDDEEDWEQQASPVSAPGLGPILSTALRGLNAVSERLTEFALQYAPANASPGVVRVAVNAGLILLALSFVRSLLSFFLTLGTILLGAYVAVKVFGFDVSSVTGGGGGGARGGGGSRPSSRSTAGQQPGRRQQERRLPDPRARQSEFKGLLSSLSGEDDSGLLDVRFERRGGGGGSGSGGSGKGPGGRRR